MRLLSHVQSSFLFAVIGMIFLSSLGCGADKTPKGPDPGSVQAYLDENPEVANREDEVEEDGDVGDGSDE